MTSPPAVLIAGLLHLALVLLICVHGPSSTKQEPQERRLMRWVRPALILLSFVYLACALYRGGIQDYYFFIQMWREVQFGHDPWFYAYGAFGKYPMNAYGPLFNIFALAAWLNPLFPKLLFAAAYLAFANWLILDSCKASPRSSLPWPLLVLWFWMPYCWVEIAEFGHFDVLVGLLCVAAVEARVRQRDVAAGVFLGLGVLLKLMPIVLLPFLVLDGRRLRCRSAGRRGDHDPAGLWDQPGHLGTDDFPPLDLRGGTIVASPIDLPVSQGPLFTAAAGSISSTISIRRPLSFCCSRPRLDLAPGSKAKDRAVSLGRTGHPGHAHVLPGRVCPVSHGALRAGLVLDGEMPGSRFARCSGFGSPWRAISAGFPTSTCARDN